MNPPILILRDIHLTFGGTPLLEGAELSVSEGERLCLVGRNGSGKSTLLKIAAGLIEADQGERFLQPGITLRYLPQEPDLSGHATVLDYVKSGLGPSDEEYRALYLLQQLGLTGDEDPGQLSGGEARRAALAHVLAPSPDILLLDEPTNHLDLPAIEWLEGELRDQRAALVMISHDRRFLENLSKVTTWLDAGLTRRLDKGFVEFEVWRDDIVEQEDRARHELNRKIARETVWLRQGVKARRTRNQGRLRALYALRKTRSEQRGQIGNVNLAVTAAENSGKLVAEAKNITKSFGDTCVVRNFSTRIQRGDRIGLIGPNGAGKTTLLNLLTGALAPDEGTVRLGANLDMVLLDQKRDSLDPNSTLEYALTGGGDSVSVQGKSKHVIGYMKDFLFAPNQARTPVGALSGGERGRLMLARALARPSNLLVLDEPTNDLDLETLDLLQEMLSDYAGTVLLVSHDRDFLDRVVTSVLAAEGAGLWTEYAGGYSDMLLQRGADLDTRAIIKETRARGSGDNTAATTGSKRKLSFKDKHALEKLPGRVEALQAEIGALQKALADPALYGSDPLSFENTAARLTAAETKLAKAEDDWIRLESLREELEGS
ncbi:MAG: ATP-binding cassette domain-containing protein [Proteobacteria bacterium]|nr:ATP-binding cassette domain-containing protein [Pseudomonadota bacterium]